ncbi:hypothetical protein [Bradyrhizobium sp. WSM471]|uniref:hypothetical protein n=1 Tax=Bradyrhizobium sp. WSM471 TaxID=319017 RepID=UPI00024D2B63|nr:MULTISPECIES: hypothetical protein [Bradyrhizobium]EHR03676.1 hypothetical protein Bra471DRAFT_04461 [Bradyrhizobium sp. WSM471]UFW38867.1 hypothetical protein BcanWSM471_21835 [Bradyrhizobium canariense]
MPRPKTRFIARYDGVDRELLAAQETSDGSVMLFSRSETNHEDGGANVPISFERYSLHPSDSAPGTTIKRSTKLADGRLITSAAFIENSKGFLLWNVYARRCARLDQPRYTANPKPRDKLIRIADPFTHMDTSSPVYFVFAALPVHTFEFTPGFRLQTAQFTRFQLAVYSTYMNVPAIRAADIFIPATSQQHIRHPDDAAPIVKPVTGGSENFDTGQLATYLLEISQRLGLKLTERIERMSIPPELKQALWDHPLWFNAIPRVATNRAEVELRRALSVIVA